MTPTLKLLQQQAIVLMLSAGIIFTGRVSGQDEPSAGFRSRIENDWARQEGTLNRSISSVTALTELIERSPNLVNRLGEEELVESSELEKFRSKIADAQSFLSSSPTLKPDAIAQTYRKLRWASRDAIFANNLLKDTPIVFEKANRFGFQILQEYLSFYERYSNQHGGGLFRLENPGILSKRQN